MVRILAQKDVEDLLDLESATTSIQRSFVEQGQGEVTAWPRYLLSTGNGQLRTYAGGLAGIGRMGLRFTGGAPDRASTALLFDAGNSRILSLMAFPFFELRLAATVAVGVKWLAKSGPQRVTLLGSGRNAPGVIEAINSVVDVSDLRVFSPNEDHRRSFADQAKQIVSQTLPIDNPKEAVRGADIVVVLTSATSPALLGEWLDDSAHQRSHPGGM